MGIVTKSWESELPHRRDKPGKRRENAQLARTLLSNGQSAARTGAKGKDKKMPNETTNLFRRRDTFFGTCEAVGQDFGFNPLYLRLAFIAPLFFFPVQTFAAYFGLGFIVLMSRLFFPNRAVAAEVPVVAIAETPEVKKDARTEELALAA